jgi:hypothetical protein
VTTFRPYGWERYVKTWPNPLPVQAHRDMREPEQVGTYLLSLDSRDGLAAAYDRSEGVHVMVGAPAVNGMVIAEHPL